MGLLSRTSHIDGSRKIKQLFKRKKKNPQQQTSCSTGNTVVLSILTFSACLWYSALSLFVPTEDINLHNKFIVSYFKRSHNFIIELGIGMVKTFFFFSKLYVNRGKQCILLGATLISSQCIEIKHIFSIF